MPSAYFQFKRHFQTVLSRYHDLNMSFSSLAFVIENGL